MTCILGLRQDGKTYLAADTCLMADDFIWSMDPSRQSKLVRKEGYVFGCSGDFAGALMPVLADLPAAPSVQNADPAQEDYWWALREFVPALFKIVEAAGGLELQEKTGRRGLPFAMLLGTKNCLLRITPLGGIFLITRDFDGVGYCSGALGVLHGTGLELRKESPESRLTRALEYETATSVGVRPPFTYEIV